MISSPFLRLLVLAVVWGNSVGFLSVHRPTQHHNNQNNNHRLVEQRAAPTRTTRLYSSSSSSSSSSSDSVDDGDFMASLRNRVAQVQDRETKLPLIVLDAMVPRQVLKIQVKNKLLMELVRDCIEKENPFIGMVGMARLANGDQAHLKTGVEVRIVNPVILEGAGSVRLELHGGRRFMVRGEVVNAFEGGWTEARVEFLDSQQQEKQEIDQGSSTTDGRLAVARAIAKATELTIPNANIEGYLSLVDRWIALAKENERSPGQIDTLLESLADIPPEHEPSERAFWIGALINPLPAMGVAMEIRPALLSAKTALDRIEIAANGLFQSIKHMDGSARMW